MVRGDPRLPPPGATAGEDGQGQGSREGRRRPPRPAPSSRRRGTGRTASAGGAGDDDRELVRRTSAAAGRTADVPAGKRSQQRRRAGGAKSVPPRPGRRAAGRRTTARPLALPRPGRYERESGGRAVLSGLGGRRRSRWSRLTGASQEDEPFGEDCAFVVRRLTVTCRARGEDHGKLIFDRIRQRGRVRHGGPETFRKGVAGVPGDMRAYALAGQSGRFSITTLQGRVLARIGGHGRKELGRGGSRTPLEDGFGRRRLLEPRSARPTSSDATINSPDGRERHGTAGNEREYAKIVQRSPKPEEP